MTDNQKNTLPKNWDEKKLEDLISYAIGGDWGKDENYQDADYDFAYCIRGSELKNWKEEKGKSASLRKIKKSNIIKRKLQVGDILVEISGGGPEQPVGRTVVIDQAVLNFESHITKICTNFFRLIRPTEDVDSSFLNFFLVFFYFSGEIGKFQSGSNNLRNLKFPDYLKIIIPLPPLPEQQKIVQKIERLFTELETGTKALKTALNQLKIYRQAVLNHFLNDESWDRARLGEVCENVVDCLHSTAKFTDTGKFCIDTNSMVQGKILLEKARFVDEMTFNDRVRRLKPKEGDVFFSREGTVGLSAIVPADVDICLGQRMMMFRTGKSIIPSFFSFYLQSPLFERQYKPKISGTTVPHLNIRDTITFLIPLPPLEVQTQIVSEIEKRMTASDALEASLKSQLMNAENLRQSILKRAFEGKLV